MLVRAAGFREPGELGVIARCTGNVAFISEALRADPTQLPLRGISALWASIDCRKGKIARVRRLWLHKRRRISLPDEGNGKAGDGQLSRRTSLRLEEKEAPAPIVQDDLGGGEGRHDIVACPLSFDE